MKQYEHFGVMLDVSRNAVIKPEALKEYMKLLAKMGYDTVELYAEDTYEIDGEPYLGYLRGRYTKQELKDIVAYAATLGIEVIPCIQTLAHFTNPKKLPAFAGMWDTNDILMVGEERTYEFIENIFRTLAECFTSRFVNIGMDEAHMLGLGRYLDKNGFRNRFDILNEHLARVCKIADKYGFKPHMWSDMFFRLANHDEYYAEETVHIPAEVRALVPENIALAYWDYYHRDKKIYDNMFEGHLEFGREVWFAGGAWTWGGFIPQNRHSLNTMIPAMRSVREHGIKNVLITMWGDDGGECSFWSVLPALYAIRQYALGNEDEKSIKEGFEKTFGIAYDALMLLDSPNAVPTRPDTDDESAAKSLLYTDPFMGVLDYAVEKVGFIPYNDYADKLAAYKSDATFGYIFAFEEALCRTLAHKYDIGNRTRKAYLAKDTNALRAIVDEYAAMIACVEDTYDKFAAMWYRERKPFGFEVQDIRWGGLICRMKDCRRRLVAYIEGTLDRIEELEQEMLPWSLKRPDCFYNEWHFHATTTSNLAP